MKKLSLSLVVAALFLAGCTRFQYLSIDSSITESDSGFVTENDSLRIAYWFTETGAMDIEVHNLTEDLIYVDWNKSSLIRKGQSFSLANDQSILEGRTNNLEWFDTGIETGSVSGTITSPSSINFIPGGSFVRYRTKSIDFEHYNLKKSPGVEKRNVHSYQFKTLRIDPMRADRFQTLLFIADESDNQRSIYKHEFWISEVNQSQYNAPSLNGNQVKLSETTGAGQVLGVIGGAALITVMVAAEAAEE